MGALKITKVDVRRYDNGSNMKALASVVLDDCFIVRDIRVIEGNNGLFVAMPNRKKGGDAKVVTEEVATAPETVEEERLDIVYPINKEGRKMIEDAVLAEYEKVLEEGSEE